MINLFSIKNNRICLVKFWNLYNLISSYPPYEHQLSDTKQNNPNLKYDNNCSLWVRYHQFQESILLQIIPEYSTWIRSIHICYSPIIKYWWLMNSRNNDSTLWTQWKVTWLGIFLRNSEPPTLGWFSILNVRVGIYTFILKNVWKVKF